MTTHVEKHRRQSDVTFPPLHSAAEVEQITKAMEEYSRKRLKYTPEEVTWVGKLVREALTDPSCE